MQVLQNLSNRLDLIAQEQKNISENLANKSTPEYKKKHIANKNFVNWITTSSYHMNSNATNTQSKKGINVTEELYLANQNATKQMECLSSYKQISHMLQKSIGK